MGLSAEKKRLTALVLAVGIVVAFVLVWATQGLGAAGVPEGDVALVEDVEGADGNVTRERYDRAMEQAAARLGLDEAPAAGEEGFEQVNAETMQGLLLAIWAEGEIADRGLEVTDEDVQEELTQIQESFENEREFAQVVRQSRFCTEEETEADVPPIECEDVVRQGRLLALQRTLSDAFRVEPEVTDDDIQSFYDANIEAFESPATRDVRIILNEEEGEVEAAREELGDVAPDDDDFNRAWRQAADEHSQDQASRDRGGLLEGLVEGQGDPQLDERVFGAAPGELVGPFETDRGFYLIQVVETTEAQTQSLDEARPAIEQQLLAARQQAEEQQLQTAFVEKWTNRTSCLEEVEMQFCRDFVAPDPEPMPGQPEQPEPPAVISPSPIQPGSATISFDGSPQSGLPQRPIGPADECASEEEIAAAGGPGAGVVRPCGGEEFAQQAPGGLPEGAIPIGPDGQPVPGGGAPGGAAPGGQPVP